MNASTPSSDPPVKILIAEDSPTQAQRLQHILEQQGYEVGVARNGRLALEMMPQFRPALIISDVKMPEMDGYELSRRIKAQPDLRNTPVILVTTMSDPEDVIRGLECGADNFVLKPYDERYMLARVRYVLVNREMHRKEDLGRGVEIYFNDHRHFITADRSQILNLLLSTYDAAVQRNKDLTQSQESLGQRSAEVAAVNRFLDSVIETIPDMLFVKDATDLRFVRFNRAGEELLGYSRDDLVGKNDYDFFPEEEADAFTSRDHEVLTRGVVVDIPEEPIHTRIKGDRILHTKKIPILDSKGRPLYLLGISRDVTEQKKLEDALHKRNEELSKSQEDLQRSNSELHQLRLALEARVNQRTQQLTAVVEALRESEARTRLTIDTALDAVVAMDSHGLVREWNAQAETIFGWKREEAIDQPLADLVIPLKHREAHVRGLKHFLATSEGPILSRRFEITALHREGREFPVELSITPMLLQGEWTFSAFLRDITERKQIEERTLNLNKELEQRVVQRTTELVAAREAADTANRAKSTFLATMSHEIRTPMNGMFGMLELLGLTRLDAEQRVTLAIVRESSQSLLRIIDDILDFSKIEAGKLKVHPEVASITDAIEHVKNMYAGNASSRGLLLKHSTDPDISPALMFDPLRLCQILNNFVSNALKFTPQGSVEIKAELMARTNGEEQVRFVVADTGMGVSAEDQQRLFQPFTQGEGDAARRAGGTGLGLTICRRLAEMMGGTVEMVSELGKGTTMILTLSLPIADPKDLAKNSRAQLQDSARAADAARRNAPTVVQAETEETLVLLVDDHPINRMLLMRQVHALGYAAESAENGAEALVKWQSGRFGIVITDCNMPEMNGYELTRSIRRLESGTGGKRTPVIACTANALSGEADICFAAGMDDYLVKPVQLSQLGKKLDQWLPIPEVTVAPEAPSRTSGKHLAAPVATAPVDRSVIAEFSGGDASTERHIFTEFRCANDEDAAMLKRAVATSDSSQITRSTHRMLGASRMIGALDFARVCERIEHASRTSDWAAVEAHMGAFQHELQRLNTYLDAL